MVNFLILKFLNNKRGQEQSIGSWETIALYILVALAFIFIIYISFNVIIQRIK